MVPKPAVSTSPEGVLEMRDSRPPSRHHESESLREGPRNLSFNKISRRWLTKLKLGTGLGHWLVTKIPHHNHPGGGVEEEMGTSSICRHPGSTPKAPETGDLKEIWPFANYLYDP